jgi:hypothetical protein
MCYTDFDFIYYTDFIIVNPKDLASALITALKKSGNQNIQLEFSFNFLRVKVGENVRISVKAGSGIIKPKLVFEISKEDCQRLIEFYKEHSLSGAFIDLSKENELTFYGWNEKTRKDDKITIAVAKTAAKPKAA